MTIILARFMPFIRTFAPFVGGVAAMSRSKFTLFNVVGAFIWVLGIGTAGYFFGNDLGAGQLGKNHLGLDFGARFDRHLRQLARWAKREGFKSIAVTALNKRDFKAITP